MAGSSPDRAHNLNLDSLGSPDAPHQEHYVDVSGPLRSSTALSIPEAESSDEIEELETDPYPARGLPNLDFTPTHEGSLLGSIHTRIAALRSTTADAQVRYSRAINSSIPQDPVINRNLRTTVANTLWNSTAFFEEEAAAGQLLRYREVWAYAEFCPLFNYGLTDSVTRNTDVHLLVPTSRRITRRIFPVPSSAPCSPWPDIRRCHPPGR